LELEQRSAPLERVAVNNRKFRGHAAVYGQKAWIGGDSGFWEVIEPGAFDRVLADGPDVRLLLEHDPRWLLGRTTSGTLRLSTDKKGLAVEADMPDTSYAHDTAELVTRGDLAQMSFAFDVPYPPQTEFEVWERQKDGTDLRRLVDFRGLWDASLVSYPAYEGTDVALRSATRWRADVEKERLLAVRRRLAILKGNS